MKIPREIVQDLFYGDVGTRGVNGSAGSTIDNTQALKKLLAEKTDECTVLLKENAQLKKELDIFQSKIINRKYIG